jgi:4-amino-4-deoxy-L-arabinose transferase-like glycosyltransferase
VPYPLGGMDGARRRWFLALGAIVAGGLALRIFYIEVHTQSISVLSDAYWYHGGANLLVDGRGFIDSNLLALHGRELPSASHPPGYLVVLAVSSLFGFRSFHDHQIWSALIGAGTIVAVAYAGRRLAGVRVGLVAAVIAAVYPNFWFPEAQVMSETLVLLLVAVTVILAYRCWERPTPVRVAALGLVIGLTVLTRAEAVLLVPFLLVPMALFLPGLDVRRRLVVFGLGAATVGLTVAPWVLYNLSRFEEPVLVSTGEQTLLAGNCREVYDGDAVGFWTIDCLSAVNCPDPADREQDLLGCLARVDPGHPDVSAQQARYRREAVRNMRKHLGDLPFVVFAREGRVWGYYRPGQQVNFDALSSREFELSRIGFGTYYALAAGTVAGVVILRRRHVPVFPLLSFPATVALAVAATFGETRYRALAEVTLVLGAAVAVDAGLAALARRRGRRPGTVPDAGDDEAPSRAPATLVGSPGS